MSFNHFEEVWNAAENLSKSEVNKSNLFARLEQDFQDYQKLDSVPSNDIKKILQAKKLGEILFKISQISKTDDINVFTALQMEVRIAEKNK